MCSVRSYPSEINKCNSKYKKTKTINNDHKICFQGRVIQYQLDILKSLYQMSSNSLRVDISFS